MKKLKTKRSVLMTAMLLITISYSALAQRMGEHPPKESEQMHPRVEQRQPQKGPKIPNLTEEQEVQLKEIHVSMEKASLPLQSKIAEMEAKLKSISTADEINLKDAGRVIQEISDLKAQLMILRVENLSKMKEVLTDEQELALNHQLLNKPERPHMGRPGFERGR